MKKNIVALLILLLTSIFCFVLLANLQKNNSDSSSFSNEMSGKILEIKNNSIIVEGLVKSSDLRKGEKKSVEFNITSSTILKNNIITATKEQVMSNKEFRPETIVRPGDISNFTKGTGVFSIKSRENLFEVDKATALEINYITYDFPLP